MYKKYIFLYFFLYEVQSYFIGIVMNILNLFSLLAIQECS